MSNTKNIIDQYLKLKAAGIEESIIPDVIDAVAVLTNPEEDVYTGQITVGQIMAQPLAKPATQYISNTGKSAKTLRQLVEEAISTIPAGKTFTNNDLHAIIKVQRSYIRLMQVSTVMGHMQYPKVPGTPQKAVYLKQ